MGELPISQLNAKQMDALYKSLTRYILYHYEDGRDDFELFNEWKEQSKIKNLTEPGWTVRCLDTIHNARNSLNKEVYARAAIVEKHINEDEYEKLMGKKYVR